MKNSAIEWCDHTFNPWRGCTKVSPGCAHCYAETLSKRNPKLLGVWGKKQPRVLASDEMWRQPLKWNAAGVLAKCPKCAWSGHLPTLCPTEDCNTFGSEMSTWRARVFTASLADWLDDEVPIEWLARLLDLIRLTPLLDWQLLTKRPQNWRIRLEAAWKWLPMYRQELIEWISRWLSDRAPANVWLGTSVEDQTRAVERIPKLLRIPARVRFLSCEPLLGSVQIGGWDAGYPSRYRFPADVGDDEEGFDIFEGKLHWVIAGGESGNSARPMHPDWARSLRDECAAAGVPFLFKQWGEYLPESMLHEDEVWKLAPFNEKWVSAGGGVTVVRVGKKSAGRLLDGRTHDEFPRVESEVSK